MDKRIEVITPMLEKLFHMDLKVHMEAALSGFTYGMEKLTSRLSEQEKKDAMKVILSCGKDLAISFLDQKLADLDAKAERD